MKQKLKSVLFPILLAAAFLYLFMFPQQASAAICDGLALCAKRILPSMFPYFILTELFIKWGCADALARKMHKIMPASFHVSGAGATPLLIGLLGGYPLGAKAIADLYRENKITKEEAEALSGFCCNAGPAFIVGAVGCGMYQSTAMGLALYGIHVLSAILCGLLTRKKAPQNAVYSPLLALKKPSNYVDSIVSSIGSAAETSIKICSFIITFSLLISALKLLFVPKSYPYYTLIGLIELSTGCAELAFSELPWHIKFSMTSALFAFGGLCVLFQTMSVFSGVSLKISHYLYGKIKHTIIAFSLAFPISCLFSSKIPTEILHFPLRRLLLVIIIIIILLQISTRNPRRSKL